MTSVTMICEDAQASIPVPDDMRNRRVEAVFRALDETVDEDSGYLQLDIRNDFMRIDKAVLWRLLTPHIADVVSV